jgi:hypothetical protein
MHPDDRAGPGGGAMPRHAVGIEAQNLAPLLGQFIGHRRADHAGPDHDHIRCLRHPHASLAGQFTRRACPLRSPPSQAPTGSPSSFQNTHGGARGGSQPPRTGSAPQAATPWEPRRRRRRRPQKGNTSKYRLPGLRPPDRSRPARGPTASPAPAHAGRCPRRSSGRPPAGSSADGRSGCRCPGPRPRPGSPRRNRAPWPRSGRGSPRYSRGSGSAGTPRGCGQGERILAPALGMGGVLVQRDDVVIARQHNRHLGFRSAAAWLRIRAIQASL